MSDNDEQRLEAVELLLHLLAGWIDDDVLDDTAAALLARLRDDLSKHDREVCELALELLTSSAVRQIAPPVRAWLAAQAPDSND